MKKRLLALLLAVVMIIGFVPVVDVTANAAGEKTVSDPGVTAFVCTDPSHGTHAGWTAIGSGDAFPTTGGNYYLTADKTVSSETTLTKDATINLCLNGYTLRVFEQTNQTDGCFISDHKGATLNIMNGTVAPQIENGLARAIRLGDNQLWGGIFNFTNVKITAMIEVFNSNVEANFTDCLISPATTNASAYCISLKYGSVILDNTKIVHNGTSFDGDYSLCAGVKFSSYAAELTLRNGSSIETFGIPIVGAGGYEDDVNVINLNGDVSLISNYTGNRVVPDIAVSRHTQINITDALTGSDTISLTEPTIQNMSNYRLNGLYTTYSEANPKVLPVTLSGGVSADSLNKFVGTTGMIVYRDNTQLKAYPQAPYSALVVDSSGSDSKVLNPGPFVFDLDGTYSELYNPASMTMYYRYFDGIGKPQDSTTVNSFELIWLDASGNTTTAPAGVTVSGGTSGNGTTRYFTLKFKVNEGVAGTFYFKFIPSNGGTAYPSKDVYTLILQGQEQHPNGIYTYGTKLAYNQAETVTIPLSTITSESTWASALDAAAQAATPVYTVKTAPSGITASISGSDLVLTTSGSLTPDADLEVVLTGTKTDYAPYTVTVKLKVYTVVYFDPCNGDDVIERTGATITAPSNPTFVGHSGDPVNGYDFDGWYTKPNGWGDKVTSNFESGATYYANYVRDHDNDPGTPAVTVYPAGLDFTETAEFEAPDSGPGYTWKTSTGQLFPVDLFVDSAASYGIKMTDRDKIQFRGQNTIYSGDNVVDQNGYNGAIVTPVNSYGEPGSLSLKGQEISAVLTAIGGDITGTTEDLVSYGIFAHGNSTWMGRVIAYGGDLQSSGNLTSGGMYGAGTAENGVIEAYGGRITGGSSESISIGIHTCHIGLPGDTGGSIYGTGYTLGIRYAYNDNGDYRPVVKYSDRTYAADKNTLTSSYDSEESDLIGDLKEDYTPYTVCIYFEPTIAVDGDDSYAYSVGTSAETFDVDVAAWKDSNNVVQNVTNASYQIYQVSGSNHTLVDGKAGTVTFEAGTTSTTVSVDLAGLTVGEYALVVTAQDPRDSGKTVSGEMTFEITKRQITVPTLATAATQEYTGSALTFGINVDDEWCEVKSGENLGTLADGLFTVQFTNVAEIPVGGKMFNVVLKDETNTEWANGTNANIPFTFNIVRKTIPAPTAETASFVFDGTEKAFNVVGTAGYESYWRIHSGPAGATNVGHYTVNVALTDSANTQWVGGAQGAQAILFRITRATHEAENITGGDLIRYQGCSYTAQLTDEIPENGGDILVSAVEDEKYNATYDPATKQLTITVQADTIDVGATTVAITVASSNYMNYQLNVSVNVVDKSVELSEQNGNITFGNADKQDKIGSATYTVTYTNIVPSANPVITWDGGSAPTGVEAAWSDDHATLTFTTTEATPANPAGYGFTVTYTDPEVGNRTFSDTGKLVVARASMDNKTTSGDLLFQKESVLSIVLDIPVDAAVTDVTATESQDGVTANVTTEDDVAYQLNVVVGNSPLSGVDTFDVTVLVESNNYVDYTITATVKVNYKQITAVADSNNAPATFGTDGSFNYTVTDDYTTLTNADVSVKWVDAEDNEVSAPAGVSVIWDSVPMSDSSKVGTTPAVLTVETDAFATPANTYYFIVMADDGDRDPYATEKMSFTVEKKAVALPMQGTDSFVFTNTAKQFTFAAFDSTWYAIENGDSTEATNVGSYTVTVQLKYPASSYWGSTASDIEDKDFTYQITKATLTDAQILSDKDITVYYTKDSAEDITGAIVTALAADESDITVTATGAFIASYADGTITITRSAEREPLRSNLAAEEITVTVSGGASANYNDYSFKVNVTPDFRIKDGEKPDVSIPSGSTNTLSVDVDSGISFRIRQGSDYVSNWISADTVVAPLEAGDYVVEACYTALIEFVDGFGTAPEAHIVSVGTYTVADPDPSEEITEIDLSDGDIEIRPSLNEVEKYYADVYNHDIKAEYVYQNGKWLKLKNPNKLTVISDGATFNNITSGNYVIGDFELTLKDVKTTGQITTVSRNPLVIIVDGEVSVDGICTLSGLNVIGKGTANKDTFTVSDGSDVEITIGDTKHFGIFNYEGDIIIENLDAFSANAVSDKDTVTINNSYGDVIIRNVKDVAITAEGPANTGIVTRGISAKNISITNCDTVNMIQSGHTDEYMTVDKAAMYADGDVIFTNIKELILEGNIGVAAERDVIFEKVNEFTVGMEDKKATSDNIPTTTGIAGGRYVSFIKSYGTVTITDEENHTPVLAVTRATAVSGVSVKAGAAKVGAKSLRLTNEGEIKGIIPMEEVNAEGNLFFSVTRPMAPAADPGITVPVSNDKGAVDVEVAVSHSEATIKPLDPAQINTILSDENASGDVIIDLTGLDQSIDAVGIPKETLQAIVNAAESVHNDTEHLIIKLDTAELKLDDAALRAIVNQANGETVEFHFEDVGLGRLNKAQKEAVKDLDIRKGFEAYITVNGHRISDFKGGNVEIIVPYAIPEGEIMEGFSVWYVDDKGGLEKQKSTYDGKNKWFVVSHFSDYVIVYDEDAANAADTDSVAECTKDETCPIHPYTDTSKQMWYHDGVHFCIEEGLMQGVSATSFAPGMTTSRAMVVTILWRLEGKPMVEIAEGFNDVYSGDWYNDAIRWASANGIVEGYNGYFNPNSPITREQMATILWRYCKYKGIDVSVGEDTNILSYADAFDVSSWAMEAMQWACGSGLIQGVEKNGDMHLDPQGSAVRSQSATMIYRFCEFMAQ